MPRMSFGGGHLVCPFFRSVGEQTSAECATCGTCKYRHTRHDDFSASMVHPSRGQHNGNPSEYIVESLNCASSCMIVLVICQALRRKVVRSGVVSDPGDVCQEDDEFGQQGGSSHSGVAMSGGHDGSGNSSLRSLDPSTHGGGSHTGPRKSVRFAF